MSSTPALPGGNGQPGGISDVVSQDDLTRWAQIAGVLRYLTAPLTPPPPPAQPSPIAAGTIAAVFQNTFAALTSAGVDAAVAHIPAAQSARVVGSVGHWSAAITQWAMLWIGDGLNLVLGILDGIRKGLDPQVGELAVTVLNEFLGTEIQVSDLPLGISTGDHLARAQRIGAVLYNQLEREFVAASGGVVQPSIAPAQTFSGLAVNFGLASGIMGLIGGMVPIGHIDELRELGEEVATNIGLGRLVRRALTPLITTLVSNPAQWAINTKYLPTQFKEAELVNPYAQNVLPPEKLYPAMHLLGYSDDKIQAFIQMHQKRIAPAEIKLLLDHGQWTEQQAEDYLKGSGFPIELQPTVLLIEELREERTWIARLVDELEAEVKAGRLTMDEFANVVNGLPYSQPTRDIILATTAYKAKAGVKLRPHLLTQGELFAAFAAGLITSSDLRDRWSNLGLPQADQDTRLQLWLLHLNRLQELEKERQQQYQQKILAFGEKQAGLKPGPLAPLPPVPPFPLG